MQNSEIFLVMEMPVTMVALNATFTVHNWNCLILAVAFAYYSNQLLDLFHDPIYTRALNDSRSIKFGVAKLFRFTLHISFHILFFIFINPKNFTLLQVSVFASSYLSALHFIFFHDICYFFFTININTLNQQIHRIEEMDGKYPRMFANLNLFNTFSFLGYLTKEFTEEITGNVRRVGKNIVRYNHILTFPLTSTLLISMLMDVCSINYFFILIPLSARLFVIINQLITLFNLYLMSALAQKCTEKFDQIHKLLVEKSAETCNKQLSGKRPPPTVITFSDAIRLEELQIYRDDFRVFYLRELVPVNLKTFRLICAFILNYMVLLIQTSNN